MTSRGPWTQIGPMMYWPDWDTASIRVICARLSATLDSPKVDVRSGQGYALSPKAAEAVAERSRQLKLYPRHRPGKHH